MRIGMMVAAATLVFGARAVQAQNVTYDYDKEANFGEYQTYAWVPGDNLDDAFNHKRVVSAIDSQLALKRMKRVEAGENPDVLVAYHANFHRNLQVTGFSSGWGAIDSPAAVPPPGPKRS